MNSSLALPEEMMGTSSIEPTSSLNWQMVRNMRVPFEGSSTATAIGIPDGMRWYEALTVSYFDPRPLAKQVTLDLPKVEYRQIERVESLLGVEGKLVLGKVIALIAKVSSKRDWPLNQIIVEHVEDNEAEDWQYVLVVPVFNCQFEAADKFLHDLYRELDHLICGLDAADKDIMQRKVFFDVATRV